MEKWNRIFRWVLFALFVLIAAAKLAYSIPGATAAALANWLQIHAMSSTRVDLAFLIFLALQIIDNWNHRHDLGKECSYGTAKQQAMAQLFVGGLLGGGILLIWAMR
jgi:hypothetical protein